MAGATAESSSLIPEDPRCDPLAEVSGRHRPLDDRCNLAEPPECTRTSLTASCETSKPGAAGSGAPLHHPRTSHLPEWHYD
jgi:hypothetical protein